MRKKFLVKQKYLLILKIKNKMKNLKKLNLVELNAQEVKKIEGGILDPLSWAIIGGFIGSMPYLYDNRDKLIAGFKAALN